MMYRAPQLGAGAVGWLIVSTGSVKQGIVSRWNLGGTLKQT